MSSVADEKLVVVVSRELVARRSALLLPLCAHGGVRLISNWRRRLIRARASWREEEPDSPIQLRLFRSTWVEESGRPEISSRFGILLVRLSVLSPWNSKLGWG